MTVAVIYSSHKQKTQADRPERKKKMKKFAKLVLVILAFAAVFVGIHFVLDMLFGRPFEFEYYFVIVPVLCGYLEFQHMEKKARLTE